MLGDVLRQEREKQNMTVKDIEAETSIRALYISSIEEGRYDALPGEVYLKGFIRTYAAFLKLDPAAILKLYYEEKNLLEKSASQEESAEKTLGSSDLASESSTPLSSQSGGVSIREKVRSAKQEKENKFTKFFAVSTVAVVAAGLCYWGLNEDPQPQLPSTPAAAKQASAAVEPAPKNVPAIASPKQMKGVEVIAKYTDKCWTEVVADGKQIYEGTPQTGEVLTWKAEQAIVIRSGNASAMEITHNGKSVGKLGGIGEVVIKQFTVDKITDTK